MHSFTKVAAAGIVALLVAPSVLAAVTADEAARLKSELTPFGGERAGNKEGTIPAWTGGYITAVPSDKAGGRRGDPFSEEKPVFTITSKNFQQYAEHLSDGTQALLKKYPQTYRLDVYKTHRTAAAPQWVYDNTYKNALRANMKGDLVTGAVGGIPFPIPKTGAEVMWNHVLRWRAPSYRAYGNQYLLTSDGQHVLTSSLIVDFQSPYYYQDNTPEQFAKADEYFLSRLFIDGPPNRNGEGTVGHQNIDGDKAMAWVYLPGQRRVRKLPNICCDTPNTASAGVVFMDETELWYGRLDLFDWKIAGKKEVYIPYNGNRQLQAKSDSDFIAKGHVNPDYMRWELHRVWIVEATLKAGQRHQAPKGRYYCDEDSWMCTLADRWDEKGQLWRTHWLANFVAPDLPGLAWGAFGFSDLQSGVGYVGGVMGSKAIQYKLQGRLPESVFTPDALAGEGVR
jgi:Protein of unknown function (DUF1329)